MEFLRFGSSIPGSYWGCCAVCIAQDFKQDPDEKASIEVVDGDGGVPLGGKFLGPTYKDIFLQRLRIGTFSDRDMPNHAFLAVLTHWQITHEPGNKWLKILKENGFEFIRTIDNSVYTGDVLLDGDTGDCEDVVECDEEGRVSSHPNYLFGLFRNIGAGAIDNPFEPPKEWTDLPQIIPEAWEKCVSDGVSINTSMQEMHTELWNKLGPVKFLTKKELKEANVPVTLSGKRSAYPPQTEEQRKKIKELQNGKKESKASEAKEAPFKDEAKPAVLNTYTPAFEVPF